jgi:hypothetical protein
MSVDGARKSYAGYEPMDIVVTEAMMRDARAVAGGSPTAQRGWMDAANDRRLCPWGELGDVVAAATAAAGWGFVQSCSGPVTQPTRLCVCVCGCV